MARFDNEDLVFTVPTEKCLCASCRFRMSGKYGYRNAYCEKYPNDPGKPLKILFDNADCRFYKHD